MGRGIKVSEVHQHPGPGVLLAEDVVEMGALVVVHVARARVPLIQVLGESKPDALLHTN